MGTAGNCSEEGHCWHEGTVVGSLYCCKCGQYLHADTPNPYLEKSLAKKLEQLWK